MKIIDFLEQYNIPYRTSGVNCVRGNIVLPCPFCIREGKADDTYHLGVNLTTSFYGCWRNSEHRGRNFATVIKALIGCSWQEAERLTGKTVVLDEDNFKNMLDKLRQPVVKEETKKIGGVKTLQFPKEFKKLKHTPLADRFWNYIANRGFDDVEQFVEQYDVHYALIGDYQDRIIFPLYYHNELITYVGRSMYKDAFLRYRDLEIDKSVIHCKQALWNYDELVGGKVLFVCEGLFDAAKLDFYLPLRYNATCLMTKSMTEEQFYLIKDVAPEYDEVRFFLDEDAQKQSNELVRELCFLKNVKNQILPDGMKDPGELSKEQVLGLV